MPEAIKLSSPATGEFWEIPILFEDEHLLALNKPAELLVSPDRANPERPSLIELLHRDIKRGAPWARHLGADYLVNAHRVDFGVTGVILLARNKAALIALATQFNTDEPRRVYSALVRGSPPGDTFATDAKLAPHPLQMGITRVDPHQGKRSRTEFTVRERLGDCTLLEGRPCPDRPHQVRVHLRHLRLPVVADDIYGGHPLFLSRLKPDYTLKKGQTERPLISRPALHLEQILIDHPVSGEPLKITAAPDKDFNVSIKYLRRYAGDFGTNA